MGVLQTSYLLVPELSRIQITRNFQRLTSAQLVTQFRTIVILCFENGFGFVEKLYSDNLLASLTKLVAVAKLKKIMQKMYYFHNQQTCHNEFDRFQVVICINRLRVYPFSELRWVPCKRLRPSRPLLILAISQSRSQSVTERPPQVPIFVFTFLQIRLCSFQYFLSFREIK